MVSTLVSAINFYQCNMMAAVRGHTERSYSWWAMDRRRIIPHTLKLHDVYLLEQCNQSWKLSVFFLLRIDNHFVSFFCFFLEGYKLILGLNKYQLFSMTSLVHRWLVKLQVRFIWTALNHNKSFKGQKLDRKTETPSWKNLLRNLGKHHWRGNPPCLGPVEK